MRARTRNDRRQNALSAALCLLCLFVAACGRNQTAPVSDGAESAPAKSGVAEAASAPALEEQTEQKLDPLTRGDVELYLKVMRAAADRVKNPTADDRAVLANAQALLKSHPASPTPDDAKTPERATLVAVGMDQLVAREMNIDGRTYRSIAEAVEAVVSYPFAAPNSASGGAPSVEATLAARAAVAPPLADSAPSPLEVRLRTMNAANQTFLASYRPEIESLIAIVRNPGNLPK